MTESSPPNSEPVIRTIAMPADTNPAGGIFGGWLMAQMKLAAGTLASPTHWAAPFACSWPPGRLS